MLLKDEPSGTLLDVVKCLKPENIDETIIEARKVLNREGLGNLLNYLGSFKLAEIPGEEECLEVEDILSDFIPCVEDQCGVKCESQREPFDLIALALGSDFNCSFPDVCLINLPGISFASVCPLPLQREFAQCLNQTFNQDVASNPLDFTDVCEVELVAAESAVSCAEEVCNLPCTNVTSINDIIIETNSRLNCSTGDSCSLTKAPTFSPTYLPTNLPTETPTTSPTRGFFADTPPPVIVFETPAPVLDTTATPTNDSDGTDSPLPVAGLVLIVVLSIFAAICGVGVALGEQRRKRLRNKESSALLRQSETATGGFQTDEGDMLLVDLDLGLPRPSSTLKDETDGELSI